MFVERGSGATIELIPEVTDQSSTEDLLIVAEVLRSTMEVLLTPEKVQEKGRILGIHPMRLNTALQRARPAILLVGFFIEYALTRCQAVAAACRYSSWHLVECAGAHIHVRSNQEGSGRRV